MKKNLDDKTLIAEIKNNILFGDIFDLEDIQRLQDLFSDANGVSSIITHPDGTPITKPSNHCKLCKLIRSTEKGLANCFKSDAMLGRYNPSGALVQPCLSGGLWDAGASIKVGGQHIANWMIGQIRNDELNEEAMLDYADTIGANREVFLQALNEVPIMPIEQFRKISKMLFAFANELSERAYTNLQLKNEIAEREKVTSLMKESEERFRAIFEGAPDAIILVDPETKNIVEVNNAACNLLGKNHDEIIGMSQKDLHPKHSEKYTKISFEKHLKETQDQGFTTLVENSVIKSDGSEVPVEILAQRIIYQNKAVLMGTFRDITKRKQVETELFQSEEKYRMFIDLAADAFFQGDSNGNLINLNNSAIDLTGYSREELLKMNMKNLFSENILYQKPLRYDLLEKGDTIKAEREIIRKDGSKIIIEMNSKKMPGNTYQSFFRDITKRKQTEEDLIKAKEIAEENEKKFKVAFYTSPDSVNINSLDSTFVEINEGFTQLMGYTREEVIGVKSTDLNIWAIPEDRNQFIKILKKTGKIENLESVFRCKNGTHKTALMSASFIQIKNIPHILSVTRDITARKQIENDLIVAIKKAEENSKLIENIANNIPAFIAVVDAITLRYIFTNQQYITSFNKKKEEIIGSHISEIIGAANTEYAMPYIEEVRKGKTSSYINTFELTNGKRFLNVNYVPGFDENGVVKNIIVLTFDVTSIKESEEALQIAKEKAEESDRLKSAFLQNMSHEIRTPMNAIMGFSGLLVKNYNNKPKLEKFSEIIGLRCNDLLDIINDILDISKIESGQLTVNNEDGDLQELFTELTIFFNEYQKKLGKQHIKFNMQPLSLPNKNIICTDKVKLKQILINLIGNAFKFTDSGKIECGCKLESDETLSFYVSDTGIGIPKDKQQEVFERFSQLQNGNNKAIGGTGLGLPIVKGLVHLLGGNIKLESETGNLSADKTRGSIFLFTIPYKTIKIKHKIINKMENTEEYKFVNKTILIVEDDQYNLEYLQEILSQTGLNIISVSYGNEAVKIALGKKVDLILMDIRLPDFDGYEATRQIKQHKPEIKIIAQTAYASLDEKEKALDAGCSDYISKPMDKNALLSIIKKNLNTIKKS